MNQVIQNPSAGILHKITDGMHDEKIRALKARIQKLSAICEDLNPYQEISNDLKNRLYEFQILELSDPFKITNTLLVLLEDAIDELHMLEPLSDAEKNHEIL